MKHLFTAALCALLLSACAGTYAVANGSSNSVNGMVGRSFNW